MREREAFSKEIFALQNHALSSISHEIDVNLYYPDRRGAVTRARALQQKYMSIAIIQRPDKNWQVEFDARFPVPILTAFPQWDKYQYTNQQDELANRRALNLRAYGYLVSVRKKTSGNWQCEVVGAVPGSPYLPKNVGLDKAEFSNLQLAQERLNGLKKLGFDGSVEKSGASTNKWLIKISKLPDFSGSSTMPPTKPTVKPAPRPAGRPSTKSKPVNLAFIPGTSRRLNKNVLQSFTSFYSEVFNLTGINLALAKDFKDSGDTLRLLKDPGIPSRGADYFSWHKTGRAVDISQSQKWWIKEDPSGNDMYFNIYLAHKDKTAKVNGAEVVNLDPTARYLRIPGHLNPKIPYVDVTRIASKHGWNRIKAQDGWRKRSILEEWWHFENKGGLSWYDALLEIYSAQEVANDLKSLFGGSRNRGKRLKKEGVPESVLKQIYAPVKQGNLSLRLSVGDPAKAVNLSDDVLAVQRVLVRLKNLGAASITGKMDSHTLAAIKNHTSDGIIDVRGNTHKTLGSL